MVSWSRSNGPRLRCTICCRCLGLDCRCLGLEVVPNTKNIRFVDGVLVSKCPSTKMYDLLMVSWSRSGGTALRCMFCCWCRGLEGGAPVRFVAGVLVSKWCPSTKMHDLLPVSWSRSGAPAQSFTICCRCLGLEMVPQHEDVRCVVGVLVSCRCLGLEVVPQRVKMYDLLPVSWSRSDAPALRCMIYFQCLCLALKCTIC